jgi:hypothetical protein
MIFYSWFESGLPEKLQAYLYKVLWFFSILLVLLILAIPFIAEHEIYELFFLKYIIVVILSAPVLYLALQSKVNRILIFVALLLVSRVAFNWFVLPDRIENGTDLYQKNGALVAAELSTSEPLYLLGDTRIHHVSTYYITKTRKQVLRRWDGEPRASHLYIVEKNDLNQLPDHELIFTFETRIEALKLCLIRFSP